MYVAVPYKEYVDLIACQMQCDMMQRDGVDNWEWYGASYDVVAQEWCVDAGVVYNPDDYYGFAEVADAIVAKAVELGNIILLENGDDEGNE